MTSKEREFNKASWERVISCKILAYESLTKKLRKRNISHADQFFLALDFISIV